MATVPSLRVVKQSHYKGGLKNWSNRYSFTGGTPSDGAHWLTLANAVTAVEKTCLGVEHTIIEALGYAAGSDVPVFSHTYALTGTFSPAAGDRVTPLSDCALIRWSTGATSIKNHPIYCYSYFHGGNYDPTVQGWDKLAADQKTLLQTYATDWVTGFSDGTITCKRSSPSGHTTTGSIVEEYLTHRDFPYQTSV